MTKDGLGSEKNTSQALGPIKDMWIDDTIPIEFDCFNIDGYFRILGGTFIIF